MSWEKLKSNFNNAQRGGAVNRRAIDPATREQWLIEVGLPYDKEQIEAYKRDYYMDKNGVVRKK